MRTIHAVFKKPRALQVSSPRLTLEIAVTPAEQARGLMLRAHLPPHHGMLFTFPRPERHGFWMKDTGIPLDIAWLSDAGIVLEMAQLFPLDETMRMPHHAARYAIEMNAGAFEQYKVSIGDQLILFAGKGVTT